MASGSPPTESGGEASTVMGTTDAALKKVNSHGSGAERLDYAEEGEENYEDDDPDAELRRATTSLLVLLHRLPAVDRVHLPEPCSGPGMAQ